MMFKVAFDRFYIVVGLSVDVDLDAAEVVVFQVERITTVRFVERFVVDQCYDYPARYLPRKQSLVYVVSHARTNTITLADNASDRILCIPNLERFSLLNKHGRRNVNFPYKQLAFMNLDAKRCTSRIRHEAEGSLRAYESKLYADVCGYVTILKQKVNVQWS